MELKNIFGEPRKGIHKYRIADIAIVDVVGTIVVSWLISYFMQYSFWKTLTVLFLLGIILHRLFNVRTKIDTKLFGN
jgi:uncharacterized membrane protein (DUF373 family)